MSILKRTMSTRLSARNSPYNASVTLFELDNSQTARILPSKKRKLDSDVVDVEDIVVEKRSSSKAKASVASPKKKRVSPMPKSPSKSPSKKSRAVRVALDTPHPAPENWETVYEKIKEMRSKVQAPVDTMGCDIVYRKETDPKNQRFTTLVSLLLSSRTKDPVCDAAVDKLKTAVGGTLSVDAVIAASPDKISSAINKVGFWPSKTGYLKRTAQILRDKFDSDVPKTVEELCSLPGIGPKMAFLTLQVAWKLNHGIGVDVHVHRITNRLGWHNPSTIDKDAEYTRVNLESWLPKHLHSEINHLLVGFGQTICDPGKPKCGECLLSADGLCPSAEKPSTPTKRKIVKGAAAAIEISIEEA